MRQVTTSPPPRHLLADILRDAGAIYRAGRWPEALERCAAALAAQREHARERTIGIGLTVDLLAGEVAHLIGVERAVVRHVAHDFLIDTPAQVVARELRAMRAEPARRGASR